MQLGDAGTKRVKLEQEGAKGPRDSTSGEGELSMASASVGPAAAASSTSMIGGGGAPTKAGSSGVESLPKEMHDMKIRDDKVDHSDDKVFLPSAGMRFVPVCCNIFLRIWSS